MTTTLSVKIQKDGSVELLDLFNALSLEQISRVPGLLRANPIFDDKKKDALLIKEINELIYNKKLDEQFSLVNNSSLEFKVMLSDIIEKLIRYDSK
ncbi:hypothetical protein [Paenibacillus illinoisensis]|uniref:Uncharacterized protein n=1 Tax=Paenibacillus illinoisensis TaxID=59845 RepID=A0A2W0CDP5_9BACL|nr:hypothetical protein [Paenibacillus illinoisensis]PYY28222.1 Uncharacterized protein PIL02S_03368 [Paenibacillus illinoisensis]